MMRILGIGEANLSKLLEIICTEVSQRLGVLAVVGFAHYVTGAENPERFRKHVEAAGITFVPIGRATKDVDDAEVRRRIVQTNPASYAVLVVVTTDVLDFVASLQRKANQGIKIMIAAITVPDTDGSTPLSVDSRAQIRQRQFCLIDLTDYKADLMLRPWVERPIEPSETTRKTDMTLSVSIQDKPAGTPFDLIERLTALMKRYGIQSGNITMKPSQIVVSMEVDADRSFTLSFLMTITNFLVGAGINDFQIAGGTFAAGK
ncbi:MAG: hypothetical protein HY006_00110 [Candidatus Sungbacteria bacterium]|nr:hypothetical protein [Candidatus Sungbacteria bacterium]